MAKTQTEPPGTAGSQFFIVTGEDVGPSSRVRHRREVTDGFETVERIEALGDAATEQPLQPIVLERVTVSES